MTKGILLFAHNSKDLDYALLAVVSGSFAKKNLGVPVSLVTDKNTVDWMQKSQIYSQARQLFDNIILTDRPTTDNTRMLHDGATGKTVPFINSNRQSAWDLTPYDRTLLIDVDYLIMTEQLNNYWDLDYDVMISSEINDVYSSDRVGYHDRYISDTGVHLYWATTVMFTKNQKSQQFFKLVNSIRENYSVYGDIYRFNSAQYRNDISFSVAKHILGGFVTDLSGALPPVLTAQDTDVLISAADNQLTFLINNKSNQQYFAAAFKDTDIHIMNKQSLVRNAKQLMEML